MADQKTSTAMLACDAPAECDTAVSNASVHVEACRRYDIAGGSENLMKIVALARKVAPTSAPVLITGESGTGKELISSMVHGESDRAAGPYIYVNCAAISESLLESELFGHERGAFTGAHDRRIGHFERADGGTLLLDEISETTPKLQAELLRVLEQQDFQRVGGTQTVSVNVRIISTSNRNLAKEVSRGRFRKDLYYRLGGIHLFLPPLRERNGDIPDIVRHFVDLYAHETDRRIVSFDKKMMETFEQYDWPGNVRQLRNVVRGALILGEGQTLSIDGLPSLGADLQPDSESESSTLQLREIERRTILEALRRTQRNQVKAARLLGISDRTLRDKLRRYKDAEQHQGPGEA
jgi:DNA-binding NtrC family response regulator